MGGYAIHPSSLVTVQELREKYVLNNPMYIGVFRSYEEVANIPLFAVCDIPKFVLWEEVSSSGSEINLSISYMI